MGNFGRVEKIWWWWVVEKGAVVGLRRNSDDFMWKIVWTLPRDTQQIIVVTASVF